MAAAAVFAGALFPLGRTFVTIRARGILRGAEPWTLFARHQVGDWGVVSLDERLANEGGLDKKQPLVSCYEINKVRLLVVTDSDRENTVLLHEEEYA